MSVDTQSRQCLNCNKPFHRKHRTANRDWSIQKYCSWPCYEIHCKAKAAAAGLRPRKSPSRPGEYVRVKCVGHCCSHSDGRVKEHIYIAEKAVGRCLRGHPVHHVDEVKSNNANTNLVVCENCAYHFLIHVRTRILRAGFDPDTHKRCTRCRLHKPRVEFHKNKNQGDGLNNYCKRCNIERVSEFNKIRTLKGCE